MTAPAVLETTERVAVRCDNPLCSGVGKRPKLLMNLVVTGSVVVFCVCPRCNHYNVRQFDNER